MVLNYHHFLHIEWRDKNGNVVSKTDDITSFTDGEQKGQFTVPASAQNGDIYTVVLVTGGKDVGADSFVVGTQKTTMFMNQQQRVWTNNMVNQQLRMM